MNELKYCKFCDKEKPIKDFVKSGFAIKNICKECQNKKQTQIYKNNKEVDKLQQQIEEYQKALDETMSEKIDLEQENKQLKERIEYLERSNNRREDTILEQRQEISDLEDNWNKLKEYVKKKQAILFDTEYICYSNVLDKMKELEGSDSNE